MLIPQRVLLTGHHFKTSCWHEFLRGWKDCAGRRGPCRGPAVEKHRLFSPSRESGGTSRCHGLQLYWGHGVRRGQHSLGRSQRFQDQDEEEAFRLPEGETVPSLGATSKCPHVGCQPYGEQRDDKPRQLPTSVSPCSHTWEHLSVSVYSTSLSLFENAHPIIERFLPLGSLFLCRMCTIAFGDE